MNIFPGWDSVESTAWWTQVLFWIAKGSIITALLVEVLAYLYASRKEELGAIAERDRAALEQQIRGDNNRRAEELERKLREAQTHVEKLQKSSAQRTFSNEEKRRLTNNLSRFPNQKVEIVTVMGDVDSATLAQKFMEVFREANWDYGAGSGFAQAMFAGVPPSGVQIAVNPSTLLVGHPKPSAIAIFNELMSVSFFVQPNIQIDPTAPDNSIKLLIGVKPRQE